MARKAHVEDPTGVLDTFLRMAEEPETKRDPPVGEKRLPLHLVLTSGFLMGSADAVPGVSGGTIALILGVYERLIRSISTCLKLHVLLRSRTGRSELRRALAFLLPLLAGVLAAVYIATLLLVGPTDDPGFIRKSDTAPLCYAFFFGLVVLSLREPWRRRKTSHWSHYVAAVLACAGAAVFVGLPHASREPATWMLLIGGAAAISVMLLPGISGSLLLLIIGQYTTVTRAVHDRNLGVIGIFVLGVALGVALFVPLLRRLLRVAHDVTLAALTGLMAGSLRALWPWKSNYDLKEGPLTNAGIGDNVAGVLVAAAVGAAAVILLAMLERKIERASAGVEA